MASNNSDTNVGKMIKQQRLVRGLTLHELSTMSEVSASHLGRIERGERFPSARILRKIAKPLGLGESELFVFADYLPSQSSMAVESKMPTATLDPYVARLLSQESPEVQRTIIGILIILKSIAKVGTVSKDA